MPQEQFVKVAFYYSGETADNPHHITWPDVINALLMRFLGDDVSREAQDAVEIASQTDQEYASKFAERLSTMARMCRNLFSKYELVIFYIQGLRTAVQ